MQWDRRFEIATLVLAAVIAGALLLVRLPDIVLYNPSPSIPRGFYVRDGGAPARGAIVTVRAVEVAPDYARLRDFTDLGDRFIKRIVGSEGDVICAKGAVVTINGERRIQRAAQDSVGRTLQTWEGCRRLRGEVFLLGDTPDSFDGRYWGPTPVQRIEGVWRPL